MTPQRSVCLVFKAPEDQISCESGEIFIELVEGEKAGLTREVLQNVAAAVLHYYRVERGLVTISIREFATAMVLVLRELGFDVRSEFEEPESLRVVESDLEGIAIQCAIELAFFVRLRHELTCHLQQSPDVLRFTGLRHSVKHLTGTRRWNRRCQTLSDQIVSYMRECLGRAHIKARCTMIIE